MAIHSPEFRRKRQRRRRIIAGVFIGGFVLLAGAAAYASHLERFIIQDIRVDGNHVTRAEELIAHASSALSGKYLWLFPRANALIYPRREISSRILADIPRIKEARLGLLDSRTLEIEVEERSPFSLYCTDVRDPILPAGCFFLDENGFVFSQAPSFSGNVYFIYTSKTALDEPLGQNLLPEEKFRELSSLIGLTDTLGIEANVLEISDSAYRLKLQGGGEIIWRPEESPLQVARNLEAFLADEEVSSRTDFLDEVLYIDLRFKNKVFYKFQDEEGAGTTTESSQL